MSRSKFIWPRRFCASTSALDALLQASFTFIWNIRNFKVNTIFKSEYKIYVTNKTKPPQLIKYSAGKNLDTKIPNKYICPYASNL